MWHDHVTVNCIPLPQIKSTTLMVHQCRFENLFTCLCSCENKPPPKFAFLILTIYELFTCKAGKMFVYKNNTIC